MSTKPRHVVPGFTYLITRRCTQRQFLLQPSELVTATLKYALARVAERHGIQLHAWCFLANHYHLVASDPEGRIPDFLRDFHSLVARALNAQSGRVENFWASGEPSVVRLVEEVDVLDKVIYTICNPVSSGLVPESRLWPGLLSHPASIGQTLEVERPDAFFRSTADNEATLDLSVSAPSGWTLEAYQQHLEAAVLQREAELRQARESSGQGFLGPANLRRQRPEDRPSSPAPMRKLSPRVACKNSEKRIEVLAELDSFVEEYRVAFREFTKGVRDVLFPLGTFLLRRLYGVPLATGP